MAICNSCGQDKRIVDSCIRQPMEFDIDFGIISKDPIMYGDEQRFGSDFRKNDIKRCHNCNVVVGNYHHLGCDMEECPICHKQLISCRCLIGTISLTLTL